MKRTAKIIGLLFIATIAAAAVAIVYFYLKLNEDAIELGRVSGELGYMTDAHGDWDVVMVDTEGVETILTAGEGQDYFFNFTFNGERVNFYSNRSGEFTPAQVKTDGSDLQTLSWVAAFGVMLENKDFDPAWSPDGSQLAWTSLRGMNTSLMIAQADGSDERKLTDRNDSDMRLAWSPDGTRIAFIADIDNRGEQWQVWMVDVATGEATAFAPDSLYCYQVAWSLDGTQLLIAVQGDKDILAGEFDLMLLNADGSDLRPLGKDEVFKGDPTYAPDGSQVAYMSNEEGHWHIYVMNPDGSNVRRVTEGDGDHMFPAWRPVPASEVEDAS